jgi:hypothetical protein
MKDCIKVHVKSSILSKLKNFEARNESLMKARKDRKALREMTSCEEIRYWLIIFAGLL